MSSERCAQPASIPPPSFSLQGVLQGTIEDLSQQLEQLEGDTPLRTFSLSSSPITPLPTMLPPSLPPSLSTFPPPPSPPGQVRALKREVGQLTGEKAALQREVDKLRAEVDSVSLCVSVHVSLSVSLCPCLSLCVLTYLSSPATCSPSRTRACTSSWQPRTSSCRLHSKRWWKGERVMHRVAMLAVVWVTSKLMV